MTDSGESDEDERLSDSEAIAEALRAGELDTTTRFAERRTERESGSADRSEARTPAEILENCRTDDPEPESNRSSQRVVRAELTVEITRGGSGTLQERVQEHLGQAFAPEIPSNSIQVQSIEGVVPALDDLQVDVIVAIETEPIVERLLSRNISDVSRDGTVEILPS